MRHRRLASLAMALFIIVIPSGAQVANTDTGLIGAIRDARGDDLPVIPLLQSIADERAPQLIVDYSHYGPGADAARAPIATWRWGEIIATNHYPSYLAASWAVQQWLSSPDHRSIMLGRWAGFGAAVASDSSGGYYFVAIFGTPPGAAPRPRPTPRPVARPTPRPAATPRPTPAPTPKPKPDGYPVYRYPDRMTPC